MEVTYSHFVNNCFVGQKNILENTEMINLTLHLDISNIISMCARVLMCVHLCVCTCARVFMCVCTCLCVYLRVCQYPLHSIDEVRQELCPLCVVEERPSNRGDLY